MSLILRLRRNSSRRRGGGSSSKEKVTVFIFKGFESNGFPSATGQQHAEVVGCICAAVCGMLHSCLQRVYQPDDHRPEVAKKLLSNSVR